MGVIVKGKKRFRGARIVEQLSVKLVYVHCFRMRQNFVLSAQRAKNTKLNRVRKFVRLQYIFVCVWPVCIQHAEYPAIWCGVSPFNPAVIVQTKVSGCLGRQGQYLRNEKSDHHDKHIFRKVNLQRV